MSKIEIEQTLRVSLNEEQIIEIVENYLNKTSSREGFADFEYDHGECQYLEFIAKHTPLEGESK